MPVIASSLVGKCRVGRSASARGGSVVAWMAEILCVAVPIAAAMLGDAARASETRVAIVEGRWHVNGQPTNRGSRAEGLLMNTRMVNATFEDRSGQYPEFDPEANTDAFIAQLADYAAHGVNAVTLCLQGGMPGYEGAVNSAFEPDGSLRPEPMRRVERAVRACDQHGMVVILGCYYQRQSAILQDEEALRTGLLAVVEWIREHRFTNVVLEVANEYPHRGFVHSAIRNPQGQAALIQVVKEAMPELLVTASGFGSGRIDAPVAEACDFLTPHWNSTRVEQIPERMRELARYHKPIVCNEDDKTGADAAAAMRATVEHGGGYGLMLSEHNQTYPFRFDGADDDRQYYAALQAITSPPRAASPDGSR